MTVWEIYAKCMHFSLIFMNVIHNSNFQHSLNQLLADRKHVVHHDCSLTAARGKIKDVYNIK